MNLLANNDIGWCASSCFKALFKLSSEQTVISLWRISSGSSGISVFFPRILDEGGICTACIIFWNLKVKGDIPSIFVRTDSPQDLTHIILTLTGATKPVAIFFNLSSNLETVSSYRKYRLSQNWGDWPIWFPFRWSRVKCFCLIWMCCSDDQNLILGISLIFMSIDRTPEQDNAHIKPFTSVKASSSRQTIESFYASRQCSIQSSGETPESKVLVLRTKNHPLWNSLWIPGRNSVTSCRNQSNDLS